MRRYTLASSFLSNHCSVAAVARVWCSSGGDLEEMTTKTKTIRSTTEEESQAVAAVVEHRSSYIKQCVKQAALVLPTQAILEGFVHHNPLERFEHMEFDAAINHVFELEHRYMGPGERVFQLMKVDPRKRVDDAISGAGSAFLDKGAAKWTSSEKHRGFLYFFATLDNLGFAPWRSQARKVAKQLRAEFAANDHLSGQEQKDADRQIAERAIYRHHLDFFGIPEEEYAQALRASLLEVKGWAGMFDRMESHPADAPPDTEVRLVDLMAVRGILLGSSVDSIGRKVGKFAPSQVKKWIIAAPKLHQPTKKAAVVAVKKAGENKSEIVTTNTNDTAWGAYAEEEDPLWARHTSAIAYVEQRAEAREELESIFKSTLIEAIGHREVPPPSTKRAKLQVWACIDDREESIRRHIEEANPQHIETFGVPGFFGIPFTYTPLDGRETMTQAPPGNAPPFHLTEIPHPEGKADTAKFFTRRRFLANVCVGWERLSFSPFGSLLLCLAAPISIGRLWLTSFFPNFKRLCVEKAEAALLPEVHSVFISPYTPVEAAAFIAKVIIDMGTKDTLAPLVIVLGHGSSSSNNPFNAAYQCGACQGRDGGPNARLFAKLANDPAVKAILARDHGVNIPTDTHFIGGSHNTTTDTIVWYDKGHTPDEHLVKFSQAKRIVEQAAARNALERTRRFFQHSFADPEDAQEHVKDRGVELSQIRPELNHATNAAVVLGRRDLTKGRFLDRRSFLVSYDPFQDDDNGTSLERLIAPALVVCSGISLEYLFSTGNVDTHGAGTKVPLNVVGNIGVLQGTTGDLRPGLPSQMTELHAPIRAHYIIDTPIDRLEKVLLRNPRLLNLVRNNWVKIIVRDPVTGHFLEHSTDGIYVPIDSTSQETSVDFTPHQKFGYAQARRERFVCHLAMLGIMAAWLGPIGLHYGVFQAFLDAPTTAHFLITVQAADFAWGSVAGGLVGPHGALIATAATALTIPTVEFARQYLHGEYIFMRYFALTVALLLGFNIVATAPTLLHALGGWSLFGFASVFLIGIYNDRPTVRNNTIFVFAAYRLGDLALLTAAVFATPGVQVPAALAALGVTQTGEIVAAGLLGAAFFKSSQFPLTTLFARSMEGPTPSSALGYAGLSAHLGVVLLATQAPLWMEYDWARMAVMGGGLSTAIFSTLVAKIRADRKGALAYATSGTLGLILVVLSLGFKDTALFLSLGHASFRMVQVLRSPSIIQDNVKWKAALGGKLPWPLVPSKRVFRLAWACRRIDTDFHLLNVLSLFSKDHHKPWVLNHWQQWALTVLIVVLCGAPFTPFAHGFEETMAELMKTQPLMAATLAFGHFVMSLVLMRTLLVRVLNVRRFYRKPVGKL